MRTTTYGEAQEMGIRKNLRNTVSWPAYISQVVGCFPLTLTEENEYTFEWFGKPMVFIYLNLIMSLFFTSYYLYHKEEIIREIMGSLTQTESLASSFLSIFIWTIDKTATFYLILIRKPMIRFQFRLNELFQSLISELNNNPQQLSGKMPWPWLVSNRPISHLSGEAKKINILGVTLVGFWFVYEVSSGYFHATRMIIGSGRSTDVFRKFSLIVACMLGQCSLTIPKLCLFFFISSKITLLKVGFSLLKESTKALTKCANGEVLKMSTVYRKYIADQVVAQLDLHCKLESIVVEFNRTFGIQLLSCILMSIVLITASSYLVCINFNFNFWYVITVLMPLTMLHLFVLFFVCHNSSLITIEAQKTLAYLRLVKLEFTREQEFRIWLHYSKIMNSPPVICPVNFITVNYRLLLSAITIITTYLFVLLQFRTGEIDAVNQALYQLYLKNLTNVDLPTQ